MSTKGVIVDEVFDANELDLELVRLAAGAGISTIVIGDPWQALYEFRGARPELVPLLVEHEGFKEFPITSSFRFETLGMIEIAVAARTGQPITLDVTTDVAECDVVLAPRWDTLWDGSDCVLPLSFGKLDNLTDAAMTLLLDRLVQGRFGRSAHYAEEAAVLLGLTKDKLSANGNLLGAVLEILTGNSAGQHSTAQPAAGRKRGGPAPSAACTGSSHEPAASGCRADGSSGQRPRMAGRGCSAHRR